MGQSKSKRYHSDTQLATLATDIAAKTAQVGATQKPYNSLHGDSATPSANFNADIPFSNAENGIKYESQQGNFESPAPDNKQPGLFGRTRYMDDGKTIDIVIPYVPDDWGDEEEVKKKDALLTGLVTKLRAGKKDSEGEAAKLIVVQIQPADSSDGKTGFLLVHGPLDSLLIQAEAVGHLVPAGPAPPMSLDEESTAANRIRKVQRAFALDDIGHGPMNIYTPFKREHFLDGVYALNRNDPFTALERARLAWDIVCKHRVEAAPGEYRSVNWLRREKITGPAYMLHDPEEKSGEEEMITDRNGVEMYKSRRTRLAKTWASFRCGVLTRKQPFDDIFGYFGPEFGMYYMWLGFYTKWLALASIVALITFTFGTITAFSSAAVEQTCSKNSTDIILCRQCESEVCPFKRLIELCRDRKNSSFVDNGASVFFACFITLWAVCFHEFWTRRQSFIQYVYCLHGDAEFEKLPRPEYELYAKHRRPDVIKSKNIDELQRWREMLPLVEKGEYTGDLVFKKVVLKKERWWKVACSIALTAFFVIMNIAVIIFVKWSQGQLAMKVFGKIDNWPDEGPMAMLTQQLAANISSAVISLIFIMILGKIFGYVVEFMTEFEQPRTDEDLHDSTVSKQYMFTFINFYGTLFFAAFVKIPWWHGDPRNGNHWAESTAAGSFPEVMMFLIIVFAFKQLILQNIMEVGKPMFCAWYRKRKAAAKAEADETKQLKRWEEDYLLEETNHMTMLDNYLEMVIQFGFVAMFASGFTIAPIFALLNNIFEIRVDAVKMVKAYRRPVPSRVDDIGAWYHILKGLIRISVLTNALLIAFTSDFIDRVVYKSDENRDGSMDGYVLWTLSSFNTSDWNAPGENLTYFHDKKHPERSDFVHNCRYRDYREPQLPYHATVTWWKVLAAKVMFVFFFCFAMTVIQNLLQMLIPDVPGEVKIAKDREEYQERELRAADGKKKAGEAESSV